MGGAFTQSRIRCGVVSLVVVVLGVVCSPPLALGTTVKLGTGYVEGDETSNGYDYPTVTITAARGERNRLYVVVGKDSVEVRDDGAPVHGASKCRPATARSVRCALPTHALED